MKLHFYMKSGNVVTAKNIADFKMKYDDKEITSVEITRQKTLLGRYKPIGLIVGSLILSQIEAVVMEK